jgi:hypothetical protein
MRFTKLLSITSLFCLIIASESFASYFILSMDAAEENLNVRTHIVVSSLGNDLGYAPAWAGASKALRIKKSFPNDQVLFFAPGPASDRAVFSQMGFPKIKFVPDTLWPKEFIDHIEPFLKIASLHTFGHGAIIEGFFLDRQPKSTHDIRLYPNDINLPRLVGHFTDDAIVTLNGCNNGHSFASTLSKLWGVPVAGALTGSHFEQIYRDYRFYWIGSADTFSGGLTVNTDAFLKDCKNGCIRMRPDYVPYSGHYGKYQKGLPFYKFFCNDISETKCLAGMALSVVMNVSPVPLSQTITYDEYATAVREWLCPTYKVGSTIQTQCEKRLAEMTPDVYDINYTPFMGKSMQCTFTSCFQQPVCVDSYLQTQKCAIGERPSEVPSTTFVTEYLNYLRGYKIRSQQSSF